MKSRILIGVLMALAATGAGVLLGTVNFSDAGSVASSIKLIAERQWSAITDLAYNSLYDQPLVFDIPRHGSTARITAPQSGAVLAAEDSAPAITASLAYEEIAPPPQAPHLPNGLLGSSSVPTQDVERYIDQLVMFNIQNVAAQGWLNQSPSAFVDRSRTTFNYNTGIGDEVPGALEGSALFAGADNTLAQDNSNFFYDSTNHRLGLGTNTPSTTLDVSGDLNVTGTVTLAGPTTANNFASSGVAITGGSINGTPIGLVTPAAGLFTTLTASTINSGFTAGSVVFQGASGLAQDNANFFYDDTNNRLGIGTTNPAVALDVAGQVKVSSFASDTSVAVCSNSGVLSTCNPNPSGVSLQQAYDAGNTITTTDARDIEITLADTATDQTLEVTQAGTADAFRVNDDGTFTDSTPFVIDATGSVGIGTVSPGAQLQVTAGAAGTIGEIVRGASSQTADLLQFQNSSGQLLAKVTSGGVLTSYSPDTWLRFTSGPSNETNILQVYNSGAGDVNGSLHPIMRSYNGPMEIIGQGAIAALIDTGRIFAAQTGLVIKAHANQSVDLFQIRNSSSTVLSKFDLAGNLVVSATGNSSFAGKVGINQPAPTSKLHVVGTGTYAAAGISGINSAAHTVTLSGANPTTYATFDAASLGAMTLAGTNANQTVTDAASLAITSAPVKSTNVALTNTHGLLIRAGAVSTATNSYGLTVNAQTGATNNYAAAFLGGNVGIGVTTPSQALTVGASSTEYFQVRTTNAAVGWNAANATLYVGKDATTSRSINAAGSVNASGADYAEYFAAQSGESLAPGEVACLAGNGQVKRCPIDGSAEAVGVVSTQPAFVGNDTANLAGSTEPVLIGLAGQVPVKVTGENGSVHVGDYLTLSVTQPGRAMKATSPGYAIGKVLSTSGTVIMLVQSSYYVPTVSSLLMGDPSQEFIDLNLTDASAFGNLVVTDTLYVGAKLIVNGTVQAKEVDTDKLCVGTVCVTQEQFLKMVQKADAGDSPAEPAFSPTPTAVPDPTSESSALTQEPSP